MSRRLWTRWWRQWRAAWGNRRADENVTVPLTDGYVKIEKKEQNLKPHTDTMAGERRSGKTDAFRPLLYHRKLCSQGVR